MILRVLESLLFGERARSNLERELGQMLNKLCGNKKAKLCKELGISEKQNGLETNVFLLWINA